MLYNSLEIFMVKILIDYMCCYIIVVPFAIFLIANLLTEICKIRNEKNDRKIFFTSIILSLLLSIVLSSGINIVFKNNATKINE